MSEQTITLGGGCFWCIEAPMQKIRGVQKVISGYAGGKVKNPTYREVCSGLTGHAEVVQVTFDDAVVSLETILEVFFSIHDPTTLNRQGADVGSQYRSAIYYQNEEQASVVRNVLAQLQKDKVFDDPIVTEVEPLRVFFPAEDYHQDYYNNNPNQPYCSFVVKPKVEKVKRSFQHLLKE